MLGPLAVDGSDGHGLRDRVVLEVLVVRANEAVDPEVLADAVWADAPPTSWPKVVQGCISRLRKHLGRDVIETTSQGSYLLRVTEEQVDSHRFERMVARAHDHLADGDPDRAVYVLDEALALWRGRALADLDEWAPGRTEAERLDGLRMDAEELRVEAGIAAGRARAILDDAQALVRSAPLRERRWAMLARALYLSGRQAEALGVLAQARRMLRDELGLDPGAELLALEEAILRQDPDLERPQSPAPSLVCPYRGLLAYESEDAETFFGREADVAACLDRLRAHGVLAVVGPSGSGKSSLVRAGVVAALEREGARTVVTTPGARPLDPLAVLPSHPPFPVLVVDQAEEAVTLCTDPSERSAYLDRLATYEGRLVLALRADRLGELSTHHEIARRVERGLFLLSPMSEDNLRAAIEGPARQAGLRLEPGLVDLLVREVEGEPGALPMLSHVLRQTWERREGPTLTVDGYRATGGIRDAVARSAEHLFTRFDDHQQAQVRALFLRLVTPGDDGVPVRARVPRHTLSLDASHEHLVDVLAAARLVSSDEGDVQIAHEALAREWPRLRGWLEDDVDGQRVFRHLAAAAEAWDSMGRPDSELYRGTRLAGATEWADRHRDELTATERSFLDASGLAAERELRAEARTNRRLRLALGGVGALLVAATVAGVVAVDAARRSDQQARLADSRRLSAEALTTVEPDLAVLLAMQAVRLDDSRAARSALDDVLEQRPELVAAVRGPGFEYLDVSADGRTVAATGGVGGNAEGVATYDAEDLSGTGGWSDAAGLALAFAPDGRSLAVAAVPRGGAGPERPLHVLDARSLAVVADYGGLADGVSVDRGALSFSADGTRLAAATWRDGSTFEAVVWDTDRPDEPVLRVPTPHLYAKVLLSPDGTTLYVAERSGDQRLRAVDVGTGAVRLTDNPEWRGEREGIIALSPDGQTLARSDVGGVAVLDARTFERRFTLSAQSEGVSALEFAPDGRRLAAGYADGTIVVWDLASRGQAHTLHGHAKEVSDLGFRPDGSTLYSVAPDKLLLAWDLGGTRGYPGWQTFSAQPVGFDLARSVASPDGTTVLYYAYGGSGSHRTFEFRDLATGDVTPVADVGYVRQFVWSPDSSVVLTVGGTTKNAPFFMDDGPFWLQTWDPRTGRQISRNERTAVTALTYTSDGSAIWAVDTAQALRRVDARTLEFDGPAIALPYVEDADYVPLLAADDRTVVLNRWVDTTITVVDLASAETHVLTFASFPYTMALSPDGGSLAVYFDDGTFAVLDVGALRAGRVEYRVPVRPFTSNHVWEMTYTADGAQVVTTGNGVVDLWDAATLQHVRSLNTGGRDDVAMARPLADGHTLVIAHPQGQVLRWDTRPQHLLDVACRLAGRNLTAAEWGEHVGDRPYERTCPDLAQP